MDSQQENLRVEIENLEHHSNHTNGTHSLLSAATYIGAGIAFPLFILSNELIAYASKNNNPEGNNLNPVFTATGVAATMATCLVAPFASKIGYEV